MSVITRFLGFNEFSDMSKGLFKKYLIIRLIFMATRKLSDTIYVLFLIDQLGYVSAAAIISTILITQLVVDYPSGSLGDWIGQKWVLTIAFICYGVSYTLLFSAATFTAFIFMAIFEGLARAQASGALESWLDNNFQKYEDKDKDPDRKNYGFTMSRFFTLSVLFLSVVYSSGGYLAENISRRFVFLLQVIFALVAIICIQLLIQDGEKGRTQERKKGYLFYFVEGFKFLVSSRAAFFYIMGMSLFYAVWGLWVSLLAFPIFYSYTGSDTYTSLIRSIGFIGGVFIQIFTSNLSKKIPNSKFPYFISMHGLYYFAFVILMQIKPFNHTFDPFVFAILVVFELVFNMTIWPIALTLYNRIMLDFIPSESRNSIYSLLPTIENVMVIPLLMGVGWIIDNSGLLNGTWVAAIGALISSILLIIASKSQHRS